MSRFSVAHNAGSNHEISALCSFGGTIQLHQVSINTLKCDIVRGFKRQADALLQDHTHHAERRTAERIGVLRAGRLFVDGPEADERVELAPT